MVPVIELNTCRCSPLDSGPWERRGRFVSPVLHLVVRLRPLKDLQMCVPSSPLPGESLPKRQLCVSDFP